MSEVTTTACPSCGAQVSLGHAEFVSCPYCGAEVRRTSPTGKQLLGQLGIRVADPAMREEYAARQRAALEAHASKRRTAVVLAVLGIVFAVVAVVVSQLWWRSRG
jgi:hypothetical protein